MNNKLMNPDILHIFCNDSPWYKQGVHKVTLKDRNPQGCYRCYQVLVPPPPKQGISGVVLTKSNMSYHKAIRVTNPTYFYWAMPERTCKIMIAIKSTLHSMHLRTFFFPGTSIQLEKISTCVI